MANSWLDSLRKAAAGTFKTPRDLPDEAIAISCPTSLELQGSNNRTSLGCVEAQQQHQPGMASRPSARNAVMRRNPTRGESAFPQDGEASQSDHIARVINMVAKTLHRSTGASRMRETGEYVDELVGKVLRMAVLDADERSEATSPAETEASQPAATATTAPESAPEPVPGLVHRNLNNDNETSGESREQEVTIVVPDPVAGATYHNEAMRNKSTQGVQKIMITTESFARWRYEQDLKNK